MGKEYGKMPTEVMDRPAWKFWMDARIRAAGAAWENEARRKAQQSDGPGGATEGEKEMLVEENESRADARERRDGSAPSLDEQMAALDGDS